MSALNLNLTDEERRLLVEALRNQTNFCIDDGYEPDYADKFAALTMKVEQALEVTPCV